jgi:hypothetical protein
MKLLELFSGTQSVGKVARELEWEVTCLDRDMKADIQCDIMDWDYKNSFAPGAFDMVWASPPCTEYSKAKTVGVRRIDEANDIVQRTIDIILYFKPRFYIIENPQTGLLKEQSLMSGIMYDDVDYCKYGMHYRKRTRLWNNIINWEPRPLCLKDCGNMVGNRHIETAQRGPNKPDTGGRQHHKQSELYRIPPPLLFEIFEVIRTHPNNSVP